MCFEHSIPIGKKKKVELLNKLYYLFKAIETSTYTPWKTQRDQSKYYLPCFS